MAIQHYSSKNKRSRGFSFSSFLIALFVGVPFVIMLLRTVPVYLEYFAIKRAVLRAAKECVECTKEEVRGIFNKQAQIDDITSVKPVDIDVKKAPGRGSKNIAVSVEYSRKQELIEGAGVSLLFDFEITEP